MSDIKVKLICQTIIIIAFLILVGAIVYLSKGCL